MWYVASLFFVSVHPKQKNAIPLWEEEVVLMDSPTDEEAANKAEKFGKAKEHKYKNAKGETVEWRFVKVERVCQLDTNSLVDGTELFSRFLRNEEAKSLLTPFDE